MKKNILFGGIIFAIIVAILCFTLINWKKNGPYVVGSLLPLSGDISKYGVMMQNGQLLAAEEIKSSFNDSIEIVFYNTEMLKDKALSRLIEAKSRNIKYFVEIFGSDVVGHCLNSPVSDNLFILSGVDTDPGLIEKGNGRFWRIMPNDKEATKEMFLWMQDLGFKSVVILYTNDDWGKGLLSSATLNLKETSIKLINQYDVNKDQTSFSAIVTELMENKPDAVCLFVYPTEGGRFIKEAKRQGLNSQFFATENFTGEDMVNIAKEKAQGVNLIIPSTPDKNQVYSKMISKYKEKYKSDPTIFAIKGYDAVLVMYDLLKKSKDRKIETVQRILKDNYVFQGASGKISFNDKGEFIAMKYERNRYALVDGKIQLTAVQK